jgi:hypothetical protein
LVAGCEAERGAAAHAMQNPPPFWGKGAGAQRKKSLFPRRVLVLSGAE